MSDVAVIDRRKAFTERAQRANLLEYWAVGYRTSKPETGVVPYLWRWSDVKSLMEEAGRLVGIDESERRGLVLANPGLGGLPYMTNTLFGDVQLLTPGEAAPAHRHTTSASRFFMEGTGGYTTVEGERCTMGPGDLVINPSWAWHDHGNDGKDEITYLNILDVPLATHLGCVFYDYDYAREGDSDKHFQSVRKPINASHDLYATGGIMPKFVTRSGKPYSPQLVYRWESVITALDRMKSYRGDPYDGIIVEYVNPESGGSVMPTMSFNMQLLKAGERTFTHRHTASTIYCVVQGRGYTQVEETRLEWGRNDIFVVPSWSWHEHVNLERNAEALIFSVTDMPAVQKLGLYREEGKTAEGEIVRVER
ncbi:MAG: cupin domain-containing protein [Candidatus Rokubacteria bacterium]|nr:cupin domain-containing protein [Candidatus Rokubacteria bacterium]